MRSSAKAVLTLYAQRARTNNPKTHPLRQKKQEVLRRYGDRLRPALVRAYAQSAAQQFADGDRRQARRFYNGAFEFGDRDQVCGNLLRFCLADAQRAYADSDHRAVWRLLAAVHSLTPAGMSSCEVNSLFARYGVVLEALDPEAVDAESARWLRGAGFQSALAGAPA